MIQSRDFRDSQSDGFQQSSQIKSDDNSDKNRSSQDIKNDDSDQDGQQSSGSYENQQQQDEQVSTANYSKEQILEKQLLKIAMASEQKRKPFQREIMGDIVDKLKGYQQVIKDKEGQQLVTLRIQQLVYNKLLVLTYGCSQFRLVLAHFHLGHAYLRHSCLQQAIEHISIGIHKNQKLFQQLPKTKLFHCIMYNILAECLMKKQQFDDAIEVLQKSAQLTNNLRFEAGIGETNIEDINNKTRILLAQCFCHHKQYNQALKMIQQVLENTKNILKSYEDYAFALVQKANILATKQDYNQAITAQDEAINTLIKINYAQPEDVAQMYGRLGDYYQKVNNYQSSLSCIQKLKTLYQQIYSHEDKRVIKARRRIATSLLKNDRFKQAVNQLLQIVQLQVKVFGESSIQVARTLKLLGTVYIKLEVGDARTYLKRAMNIFITHGNKKQAQQIKQKLKILMQSSNNNNDLKILSEQDL